MIEFGAIYTENSQKIGRYLPKYNDSLNDQKTHFWFPIRVKTTKEDNGLTQEDNIYMIDTYQFEMPYDCQKDYNKMVDFLKSLGEPKNNSWLKSKTYNYYYSACVKITEESIHAFEKIANLEDYVIVDDDEFRYYDDKDIINRVMFWNYQRSGRGVRLKRKDALIQYDKKLDSMVSDVLKSIREPDVSCWELDKLLTFEASMIADNKVYNEDKIKYVKELVKYVEELGHLYAMKEEELRHKYLQVNSKS